MKTIHEKIIDWAEMYVPKFNALAEQNNMDFYTQSPLNQIDSSVKCIIVGINPGCGGIWNGTYKTTEDFLQGNPAWKDRFGIDNLPSGGWKTYLTGVHTFMNFSKERQSDSIDNDSQYVWTNVTPFSTKKANQIPAALIPISVQSTIELISILSPERIILLGVNSYKYFERYAKQNKKETDIYFKNAFPNGINIHIGRINEIPCYCIVHPTGHWPINHDFTTIVLNLLQKIDTVKNGMAVNTIDFVIEKLNDSDIIQKLIK